MIRKHFFAALAVAVLIASASLTTFAQVGELRGHVWMQQADGQKVPLADAQIDVFRTDITAKYNTKTNKKGEFVFAGLPFIGTYAVAASHPTAAPNFVPGVKVGREVSDSLTKTSRPQAAPHQFPPVDNPPSRVRLIRPSAKS